MIRRPRSVKLVAVTSFVALLATWGCTDSEAPGKTAAPPAPRVVVTTVRVQTVPIFREFVARTQAVDTVEIQARVEGVLESLEFDEGHFVTKGQVLYRLDRRTYEARLEAAEAGVSRAEANLRLATEQVSVRTAESGLEESRATLDKSQRDIERLRPLAEKDAVPKQDLDSAVAALKIAEAEVRSGEANLKNARIQEEVGVVLANAALKTAQAELALARLDLEYCAITSPIDGVIGRTLVDVGNLVGRGGSTALSIVSSVDPIYVTFAISEVEYLALEIRARRARAESSDSKEIPIRLVLADGSTYPRVGKFVTAERAVSEETATLELVAEFPNPDARLRPGQFGRCRIQVDEIQDAVLCPQRAVMERQNTKTVLVVGEGDVAAVRTISVGERFGDEFIVSEGLNRGDRVVVEGQLKARPGFPVEPTEPASTELGSESSAHEDAPPTEKEK